MNEVHAHFYCVLADARSVEILRMKQAAQQTP